MAGGIKEPNHWVAIRGGAYFRAVRCFVSGIEGSADFAIGAKSPVENGVDAVYSEHHPAAVYAKSLAVVVASLAVAQREEVD